MKVSTRVFGVAVVMLLVLCVNSAVAATVGPPMSNGPTGNEVQLVDSVVWTADFTSYANWLADVNFLLGDYGTGGTSDIQYSDAAGWGFSGGNVVVGRDANLRTGTVIYKFVTPTDTVTDVGGTVSTYAMFRGTPSQVTNLWFGINDAFVPSGGPSYSNLANQAEFTKLGFDAGDVPSWGMYHKNMVLDIPAGLSEFYVAVSETAYSSGQFGVDRLSVDAQFVPEPMTLVLLGLGGIGLLRRK